MLNVEIEKEKRDMAAPAKVLAERISMQEERKALEKDMREILDIVRISSEIQEHARLLGDKHRRIINSRDCLKEINVMRSVK